MATETIISVYYFHSDNCGSCEQLLKAVDRVSERYYDQLGMTVIFPIMDYDADPATFDVMNRFGVSNLPSLVFSETASGKVLRVIDGADWATESTIMDTLTELGYPLSSMGIGVDVIKKLKGFSWILATLILIGLVVLGYFWFTRKKKKA